jgi:hypothetical protein
MACPSGSLCNATPAKRTQHLTAQFTWLPAASLSVQRGRPLAAPAAHKSYGVTVQHNMSHTLTSCIHAKGPTKCYYHRHRATLLGTTQEQQHVIKVNE